MAKLIRQYPVLGEETILTAIGAITFVNGEAEVDDEQAALVNVSDIRVRFDSQGVAAPASEPAAEVNEAELAAQREAEEAALAAQRAKEAEILRAAAAQNSVTATAEPASEPQVPAAEPAAEATAAAEPAAEPAAPAQDKKAASAPRRPTPPPITK